jgi:hypothetical protein
VPAAGYRFFKKAAAELDGARVAPSAKNALERLTPSASFGMIDRNAHYWAEASSVPVRLWFRRRQVSSHARLADRPRGLERRFGLLTRFDRVAARVRFSLSGAVRRVSLWDRERKRTGRRCWERVVPGIAYGMDDDAGGRPARRPRA